VIAAGLNLLPVVLMLGSGGVVGIPSGLSARHLIGPLSGEKLTRRYRRFSAGNYSGHAVISVAGKLYEPAKEEEIGKAIRKD